MDLSAIEAILEIARTGSISKAAQNLFISQPGVSKILKKFEEDVGIQIFERISTGVRPTPMGQKFIEGAQDIMDQVDQLEHQFQRNLSMSFMELNLASMSYQFMQDMLGALYERYKQNPIRIRYIECSLEEQIERVSKGDTEIAVNIFWKDHLQKSVKKMLSKGIEYHRIGPAVPYLGISRNSRKLPVGAAELDPRQIAGMPMVTISPSKLFGSSSNSGWGFLESAFHLKLDKNFFQEIIVNNTGSMQELVCQLDGFTIILLNPGIYQRYGFSDKLHLIPIADAGGEFELGWLQRSNTVRQPLANEFVNLLRESSSE